MKNVLLALVIIYLVIGVVFGGKILVSDRWSIICNEQIDSSQRIFTQDNLTEIPQPTHCYDEKRSITMRDIKDAGLMFVFWGYYYLILSFIS
ncbi:MAG: hypothetical protein AAB660_02130 [Patescibacteria group bacterium]